MVFFLTICGVCGDQRGSSKGAGRNIANTMICKGSLFFAPLLRKLPSWIPEPFETVLEDIMIDKALGAFVDFIVDKYTEVGIFN